MNRMTGWAVSLAAACALLAAASPAGAVLALNEVLSAHVKEADGTSGQNTNRGSGIKTNHLQAGAVTSAKIRDGNVFTADLADGSVTASKVGFYSRVIVVDVNGGGDFTSPVDAMNAVPTMSPAPSASDPVLVKIMPGVYDVGTSPVIMVPGVDIEGSGEKTTLITGAVPTNYPAAAATVVGSSGAEIRFLSIANTASGSYTVGFLVPAGAGPSLLHVTASAEGTGTYKIGVWAHWQTFPTLTHVTATARGGEKAYGIYADSSSATLVDTTVTGTEGSLWNIGAYLTGNPVLSRVTATAYGGAGTSSMGNSGIVVYGEAAISDTTATASANASRNVGLEIDGTTGLLLTNVTARGKGALAYGMMNFSQGDGTPDTYLIRADRCTFEGASASVWSDLEFRVNIGASRLAGGAAFAGGGTLGCAASYDDTYAELGPDCAVPIP